MKFKDEPKLPTFVTRSPQDIDYSTYPYFLKVADDFVEKFYDTGVSIDFGVYSVPCADLDKKATLGHFLTMAIRDYVIAKSEKNPKAKEKCADALLSYMTQAQGLNLIKIGEGTKAKIANFEQQIRQLQDESEQLRKKLVLAEKENEDLHKALDTFAGRANVSQE